MRIKLNIKTKSQGMKLKKKISKKYSRPYALESKE
jgi:hypothetical protein